MSIKYPNREAAERVCAEIERDVPSVTAQVNADLTVTVWAYEQLLSPSQRSRIQTHDVRTPPPPDPSKPFQKDRPKWREKPIQDSKSVCRRIFRRLHADGLIDDRKLAMQICIERGINKRTAGVYYRQFREEAGLIPSVRKARTGSRVAVKAKPPTGHRVRNNITEPQVGTFSRLVWDYCDNLWHALQRPPTQTEVVDGYAKGGGEELIKKAYKQWRAFYDIPPQQKPTRKP